MAGRPAKKVKTALDETRLLILGAQVLFGFQLHGVFQDEFSDLPRSTKLITCAGQGLMVLSIALLIAPSMQHRLVERGQDTNRLHQAKDWYAGWALLPFAISLGISVYVIVDHLYGRRPAFVMGTTFCLLAGFFWLALEMILTPSMGTTAMPEEEKPTPLPTKIEQMLTEARVILPGAQALLGFQLTVTLTRAFSALPENVKLLHVGALCAVGLAVVLLMTPAALHRITFRGEDTNSFLHLGSGFVIAAAAVLGFGIAGDLFVASYKAADSGTLALLIAIASLVFLGMFWFGIPLYLRRASKVRPGRR